MIIYYIINKFLFKILNLKEIAEKFHEKGNYFFEYNNKKFNAMKLRLKEPKTIALIFDSGRIVVTGAKNEEDSEKAAKKFAKIIRSVGYKVKFKDEDGSAAQKLWDECEKRVSKYLKEL